MVVTLSLFQYVFRIFCKGFFFKKMEKGWRNIELDPVTFRPTLRSCQVGRMS